MGILMVKDRFLSYVAFDTASDEESETVPSTAKQKKLGAFLVGELKAAGLSDAMMDERGYVYAHLAATAGREGEPVLALIAHMDTSPAASGAGIRPSEVLVTGEDIRLANGTVISIHDTPELKSLSGERLIVTDGNTLLGADDKAGVAEIVETVARFASDPALSHPGIAVCFTPDEEIGRGADYVDLARLGADYGYTVDGGVVGEIEYENFNAASAKVVFHGVNIHPGSAKGVMKNACLMLRDYLDRLPKDEDPAHTDGYEGFYHVTGVRGEETEAEVRMILRDHDRALFEKKKETVLAIAREVESLWGAGTVTATVTDSYYNMKEKVLPYLFLVEDAEEAMTACGVTPRVQPIRGGTDGARLSFMGLPCPNLSTGGINFHSVRECIPVSSLDKMVEVLIRLVSKKRPARTDKA